MPASFGLAMVALVFGALAIIFFLIFIVGLITGLCPIKIIGGILSAASIGIVLLSVAGIMLFGVMVFVTDELPRTRNKPEIKDIVGVYKVRRQTGTFAPKIKTSTLSEMSINLRQDGSFDVNNIPLNSVRVDTFCSGTGTWKLECERVFFDTWDITLSFMQSEGSGFEDGKFVSSHIFLLRKQKAPFILYEILGDPDEGWGLEFERIGDLTDKTTENINKN